MAMWMLGSEVSRVAAPRPDRRRIVRDLRGLPASMATLGALELRLATTKAEIRQAQRLRYRVFFEEGHAKPDRTAALIRRDVCAFDRVCDHLLVIDHAAKNRFGRIKPKVVGTYRLLRQDVAERHFGFYTAGEFDIAPLLLRHPDKTFLELGRSCVLDGYRSKRTIELMWSGIWHYVQYHGIDVMIGCASFEGTNPLAFARPLSFLHQQAKAQNEWVAHAHANRRVAMNVLDAPVSEREALKALPPLVKGYLRLGAKFGHGAVVDRDFGTTDVLVILPVGSMNPRTAQHLKNIITRQQGVAA